MPPAVVIKLKLQETLRAFAGPIILLLLLFRLLLPLGLQFLQPPRVPTLQINLLQLIMVGDQLPSAIGASPALRQCFGKLRTWPIQSPGGERREVSLTYRSIRAE